ncbi:MAG: Wzz/FepE/Etk N-terminal domain-containing protein [Beijerinckiaceae bacterium]|nr:Wzz/FepE/Etk N-terminal domain-containing protein [Beijerinckiaceae bacterium]
MNQFESDFRPADRRRRDADIDISAVVGALWQRKLVIATFAVLGLILARVVLFFISPTYLASSVIVLELQPPGVFRTNSIFSGRTIDQPMVESQVHVLGSAQTVSKVIERLNLLEDPDFMAKPSEEAWWRLRRPMSDPMNVAIEAFQKSLNVDRIGTSNAIRISFRGKDPDKVAQIANATARVYIASQLAQQVRGLEEAIPLEDRIVVTRAAPPSSPISPNNTIAYAAGILLGGLFGVWVSLIRRRDERLTSVNDLAKWSGSPVLGVVPFSRNQISAFPSPAGGDDRSGAGVVLKAPINGAGERDALQHIAVSVLEHLNHKPHSVVGVVAADALGGASSVCLGLATILARESGPTLLIDCEGTVLEDDSIELPGLRQVFDGTQQLTTVVKRVSSNLMFLPLGPISGEIDRPRADDLVKFVKLLGPLYKHVLLNLASLESAKVRSTAPSLDGLLVVARSKYTKKNAFRRSLKQSGKVVRSKIIGGIIIETDPKRVIE